MGTTYHRSFNNPYPNGWKNQDESETTPVDKDALQAHTDALEEIDNFLEGVNKDQIGSVKKRILTMAEYNALPSSKYTDGVIYFVTDGGSGISYPNYESEVF